MAAGLVAALFGLGVTVLPSAAAAACSAQDLAAARATIEAACGCPTSGGHGGYVQCAKAAVAPKACRGPAVKCAAKSTCGTSRVRCCRTFDGGKTKCSIRSSAAKCRAPKGGSAVAGTGSCCDCVAVCGNGVVDPGEECDPPGARRCPDPSSPTGAFVECGPTCACPTTTTTTTTTSTTQPQACRLSIDPQPTCGGACPPTETCVGEISEHIYPECACIPEGVTSCAGSPYPQCGGFCTGGKQCQAFHLLPGQDNTEISACACVDPQVECAAPAGSCTRLGVCPPGKICDAMGPPVLACGCGDS